jgi:hypothetical protein
VDRNRRKELRVRRRFSCEVRSGDARHVGAVLDLSQHGLFVQTRMHPRSKRRIPLDVTLRLPARGEEILLSTELVRHFRVPAALLAAAGGGLGLSIRRAPDAWSHFVGSLSPQALLTSPTSTPAPARQAQRPRCRLCGAAPVPGTPFCGRCHGEARRTA